MYSKYAQSASLLISYEYLSALGNDGINAFKRANEISALSIMDSGVFSARKRGEVPDVKKVIEAYRQLPYKPTYVVNIDYGTVAEQYESIEIMHKANVPVLPVIHADFTQADIDRYLNDFEYVAIGTGGEDTTPLLNYVFSKVRQSVRIHGFAIAGDKILRKYPLYSVDASTFTAGLRYSEFLYFKQGKMVRAKMREKHQDLQLRYHGRVAPRMNKEKKIQSGQIVIREVEQYEQHITDYWQHRGISWK